MSEGSGGEKTEQPSPKKIRDARKKGQVARSQEVVTTITLLAVIAYLWASWDLTVDQLVGLIKLVAGLTGGPFEPNWRIALFEVGRVLMEIMAPVLGVVVVAALASNFLQVGLLFAFEGVAPKLSKISPAAGAKRIFSMKQIVEVAKSIVKIVFLSVLLYFVLRGAIGPLMYALPCGFYCISDLTGYLLTKLLVYSAFAFILVSAVDFIYQKHTHTKSLMMTKDEVKREYKESEGDPEIKGKRKQLAQELLMSDDGEAARKSTAVVVNPTHVAVVLRFVEGETPLPTVVAKGLNKNAHFLRTQAEQAGVPVFRNVTLARALYAEVGVDEFVPEALFGAVAEVLVWVARNKERLYKGPNASGVIDMDAGDHRAPPKGEEVLH